MIILALFALCHILCNFVWLFEMLKDKYIESWIGFTKVIHPQLILPQPYEFYFNLVQINHLPSLDIVQPASLICLFQELKKIKLQNKARQSISINDISSCGMRYSLHKTHHLYAITIEAKDYPDG